MSMPTFKAILDNLIYQSVFHAMLVKPFTSITWCTLQVIRAL